VLSVKQPTFASPMLNKAVTAMQFTTYLIYSNYIVSRKISTAAFY